MRAQLTIILLLGSVVVAAAQSPAPELPSIGLPLPRIGLPHPPTGLPVPQTPGTTHAERHQRPPDLGHRGSRRPPAAVYLLPTYVFQTYVVPAVPESPPVESAPAGGRLRVDIEPDVVGQVYLDGYYVGSTGDLDRAMVVASGPHTIEIRADGYRTVQDDIVIAPGRAVTYRSVLVTPVPDPTPAPAVDAPAPAQPGSTTFYFIPGCYAGNVRPEDAGLPAGCDPRRAVTVKR